MKNKINLVTGGTGFLGSHLIDNLMKQGEIVFCLDNNFTGKDENIKNWIGNNNFKLIKHDVIIPSFWKSTEFGI